MITFTLDWWMLLIFMSLVALIFWAKSVDKMLNYFKNGQDFPSLELSLVLNLFIASVFTVIGHYI
jgi:hypothetical protein